MSSWPEICQEDYQATVIRLATLTEDGTQYLVFGSVELYPTEIPLPPSHVKLQRKNAGNATGTVSVTTVSLAEGLSWYESAVDGDLKVPGLTSPISLKTVGLSPEPGAGRLLLSNELPCGRGWHGGLRANRLVPMSALSEPISQLCSGEEHPQRAKLRIWFADLLGFDILAHDDLVGGLVLLAPNPVTRSVSTYIKEIRADGGEVLGVKAALRRGYGAETLQVRLREERPGGTAIQERRLDKFGMAEINIPEQCERTGLQLVCDKRGVLSLETPAFFFRSVSVTSHAVQRMGQVEVPARKKGEAPTKQSLTSMSAGARIKPTAPPPKAAVRLRFLQGAREKRTGYWRPDGFLHKQAENERIFCNNRTEAELFVHQLVQSARHQVIFVDPYFDHIDVRRFALAQQHDEVAVAVLTGRSENLWSKLTLADGTIQVAGDAFSADLSNLDAELQKMRRTIPDVRLMGGSVRTYHDRFLLVDEDVWHVGHSFNQIGYGELSVAVRMSRPEQIAALIRNDLAQAEKFVDAWSEIKAFRPPPKSR